MSRRLAFVAGATGYTGQAVVRALVARGVAVAAHVRPDSARRAEWERQFTAMGAEPATVAWEPAAMRGVLAARRPTHLFALLGTTRARARREGTANPYEQIDYGLTRLLLDAALAAALSPAPKFVYLSSAGVGPGARGAYIAVRWRLEEELRQCGLPYVIARPSFITGADREEQRPAERVGAAATDALLGVAGGLGFRHLRDRYHSTNATTLAAALVRLALDPGATAVTAESETLRAG